MALGTSTVLLAQAIFWGFYDEAPAQVYQFNGHLSMQPYAGNVSLDTLSRLLTDEGDATADWRVVRSYATQAVLVKTATQVQGLQFKGIHSQVLDPQSPYDSLQAAYFSTESIAKVCLLGVPMAERLGVQVGDTLTLHFLGKFIQYRRLRVVGLFQSGLEELDTRQIIGDLDVLQSVQRLPDLGEGIELVLRRPHPPQAYLQAVKASLQQSYRYDLRVLTLAERYPQLFDWLGMLQRNVVIFLALMVLVVGFNMAAVAMVFIMERTYMIGVLKVLGLPNRRLAWIFMYYGVVWIGKGLLWGNAIAGLLAWVQWRYHVLTLNPENYVLSYVPITLGHFWWIGNGLIVVALLVALWVPMGMIVRVRPRVAVIG